MEEEKNTTENTNASMNQSKETNGKKSQAELEYNYVSVESDNVEIKFEDEAQKEGEDEIRKEENFDMGRDNKTDGGKFDYESAEDQDFNFRQEMVETKERKEGDKMSATYILLAVFIVLLGISYVLKNKSFNKEKLGQDNKIITNAEEAKIDRVEIKKGGNDTVIEKSGDDWIVSSKNGALADQEAVSALIKKSLELNKYIIASENKDKQADFEVGDNNGTDVILYEGDNKVGDFFIGKAGPDFDSTYLRVAGEDVVYLSRGYVGYYFDKEDWRDLTIYDFDAEKVNKLALKYRDVLNNVAIKKDGEIWKTEDASAKEVNKDKVTSVLNTLAKLKADDIAYGKTPKEAGFGTATLVVRLELEDGGKRNLIIGGKSENDENSYYAKREEDDTIFIVSKSIVDNLMKKKSDF